MAITSKSSGGRVKIPAIDAVIEVSSMTIRNEKGPFGTISEKNRVELTVHTVNSSIGTKLRKLFENTQHFKMLYRDNAFKIRFNGCLIEQVDVSHNKYNGVEYRMNIVLTEAPETIYDGK